LATIAAHTFGRLSARQWPPQAMLEKLLAVGAPSGRGPVVFVIDDLRVTPATAEQYQDCLARIVQDVRQCRAKLLLTCQSEVWEQFGLHLRIQHSELFGAKDLREANEGDRRGGSRGSSF